MSTWLNIAEITIKEILQAEAGELEELIDQALRAAVVDTVNKYKDENKTRTVQINLDIQRMDEQIKIDWKVIPKLAPYEKKPQEKKEQVPEGQTALPLADPDPITDEIIDADFEEIQEDLER